MFRTYDITYKGRTYHGNVTLKEHHIVERDGEHCLFRVQDMTAIPISDVVAENLARLMPGTGTLIPDVIMQELRDCDLVPDEDIGVVLPASPEKSNTLPVINIFLLIAQTCNMRCVYCYGNAGEYGCRGMMSEETAIAAVNWLMENSLHATEVSITFFGGEPLLNFPLLQQVVAYAKEQAAIRGKVVIFNITTNGTLLTDTVIAFFKKEKINPMISFDGPPEVQNRQRPFKNGRGSYNRVYANVQKLRAVNSNLTARATYCGDCDPFSIRQEMEKIGFVDCRLSLTKPANSRDVTRTEYTITRQEAAERLLAYRRREAVRLFAAIKDRRFDTTKTSVELALLAGLVDGRKRHVGCGIGRGMHAVSVNGDIYPCPCFVGNEETRLGHIRDYQVGEVNDYHRSVVETLPVCRFCWVRYFCGGGCFHNNHGITGDMHRPDLLFCHGMKVVCEDLIHGWCTLNKSDRSWMRGQLEILDPEQQL